MARLVIPNRRLTSKAVGNQLRAVIAQEVLERNWKVLTARLVWKASKESLKRAKELISYKRNQCDSIVTGENGVMFIVSCLSMVQERKRKRAKEGDVEQDEQSLESSEEADFPIVYPAINYWIAYAMPPNVDFEKLLFSKLMKAQLDITEVKQIKSRGKTNARDVLTATLMTCVQDHNNFHVKEMLRRSLDFCTEQTIETLLVREPVPLMCEYDAEVFSKEFPLRMVICHNECKEFIT